MLVLANARSIKWHMSTRLMLRGIQWHEEWRVMLLVVCFGVVAASMILWPVMGTPITIFSLAGVLACSVRQKWQSIWLLLCAGALVASLLTLQRLTALPKFEFRSEQFVNLQGTVERLEYRPEKPPRLVLAVQQINGFDGSVTPKRIRLAVRTSIAEGVSVGRTVSLNAIISPVGGALVPDGYNFGRSAQFQGIDADGYAASPVSAELSDISVPGFRQSLDAFRYKIGDAIQEAIPGQPGAIAVALTVGLRHGLTGETSEALRRAGLAHILAISGLHMGLVAGAAFFLFELLFAAIPAAALRIMPRKCAVLPAWSMTAGYLLLSGASVSSVRAFLMVSIAMLAVLMDRRVLSLRSVSLAALVILVLWPESILSIGFQMSFAAAAGLIAFYERFGRGIYERLNAHDASFLKKAVFSVLSISLTSLIAQLAITPFELYHFQTLSIAGLVSNILVLPIITFAVMPLLLLLVPLAALGQASLLAWPLAPLLALVLDITHISANPEIAQIHLLPISDLSFALLVAAFLLLLFSMSSKSLAVASILVVAAPIVSTNKVPAVLISKTGGSVGEYLNGEVYKYGGRDRSFRLLSWRRNWGHPPFGETLNLLSSGKLNARRVALQRGNFISRVSSLQAVRMSCAAGDIVILPRKYARYCNGALLIVTRENLETMGPAALYWDEMEQPTIRWANPQVNNLKAAIEIRSNDTDASSRQVAPGSVRD